MKPNILRNFGYTIGTVFLLWHTFVLIIFPLPKSYVRQSLNPVIKPYVELFHLNNDWSFYSPDPGFGGSLVRYTIFGNDNSIHPFRPIEDYSRLNPSYFRYTTLHSVLTHFGKNEYIRSYANFLCRKHSTLNPKAVEITVIKQLKISPRDYLNGIRPLNERFIRSFNFSPVRCPQFKQ